MRPDALRLAGLALVALLLGCPPPVAQGPDAGESDAGPAPLARSAKANLRFKGPERLTAELSRALELPANQLCNELGRYPCTTLVHTLALGGVDPYGAGIYEPPGVTSVSTPIATDRLVLSACAARVALDGQDLARALVFRDVAVNAAGRLALPDSPPVRAAITQLYRRGLQRDPTPAEEGALVKLAQDIDEAAPAQAAADWAVSACYVVLSSTEFLFY